MKDAKIAVYSCPFDMLNTETKGTVLIKNAKELLEFSTGEENLMEEVKLVTRQLLSITKCHSWFVFLSLKKKNGFSLDVSD